MQSINPRRTYQSICPLSLFLPNVLSALACDHRFLWLLRRSVNVWLSTGVLRTSSNFQRSVKLFCCFVSCSTFVPLANILMQKTCQSAKKRQKFLLVMTEMLDSLSENNFSGVFPDIKKRLRSPKFSPRIFRKIGQRKVKKRRNA